MWAVPTTTSSRNLPEFPFSPASVTRQLNSIPSSSNFVTTIVSPPTLSPAPNRQTDTAAHNAEQPQTLTLAQADSTEQAQESTEQHRTLAKNTEQTQAQSTEQAPLTDRGRTLTEKTLAPPPQPKQRRSAWRRFKRMGNRFATPIRSMGFCLTACSGGRRAMAFCEVDEASRGSSWWNSGEYPPEFIRKVLENNSLLGQISID